MRPILVAACAAVFVAGCGGSAGLSRKALAKKANAICAKYSKQGKELGSPDLTDPKKAQTYFLEAKQLTAKQQGELEGLEPAESVRADYKKMTDATGQVTTLLGDLADAAKAKDNKKGVALIQKLTPLSAKVSSAASGVGASGCAG